MIICSSCHAGCCRRFRIPLTGYDILKIRKTIGLNYLEFIQLLPVNEEDIEKKSKSSPVFKFINIGEDRYYSLFLERTLSKYFPDSLKCMFLQEWNGEDFLLPDYVGVKARCGIYNNRPLACSMYPAKWDDNGLTAIAKDPGKHLPEANNPAYYLCPVDLSQSDFMDNSDEIIKDLVLFRYEMDYYKAFADYWNQQEGDFGEFFPILEKMYQNRIIFEEK